LVMLGPKGMLIIPIFPLDPMSPWSILTKLQALTNHYIHQAWCILLSSRPQSLINIGNGPPSLNPLDI
jgi:hypothetical protein